MKSYKIPVLFCIKASNREAAESKINQLMLGAAEEAARTNPDLWHDFRWWDYAKIIVKAEGGRHGG